MGVIVQEVTTEATVTETSVSVNVQQTENSITVTSPLPTAVAVTSPITNTGSSTAPIIGIDQASLSLAQSQVSGLVTALSGKANLTANSFTDAQSITGSVAGSIQLFIKGANGQSTSFAEVQAFGGNTLFRINSTGYALAPLGFIGGGTSQSTNTSSVLANNTFYPTATNQIGLAVRQILNHATNLQEWQNSAGGTMAYIDQFGGFRTSAYLQLHNSSATTLLQYNRAATNNVANLLEYQDSSAAVLGGRNSLAQIFTGSATPISGVGNNITINSQTPTYSSPNTTISTATPHGLGVGQTVTLQGFTQGQYNQTWVAQAGTSGTNLVIRTNSDFGPTLSSGSARITSQVGITSRSSTTVGLIVRGAASQAHNLVEWQDSSATLLANVTSVGGFNTNSANGYQIANAAGLVSLNSGQTARIQAGSSVGTNAHVVIRRVSGATGNLTEWQNEAGTGALAWLSNSGDIYAPALRTTLDYVVAGQANNGGTIRIQKADSATAPPANQVRIMVLAGTNANTLKLVAIGPNGTPITILDNLA